MTRPSKLMNRGFTRRIAADGLGRFDADALLAELQAAADGEGDGE